MLELKKATQPIENQLIILLVKTKKPITGFFYIF